MIDTYIRAQREVTQAKLEGKKGRPLPEEPGWEKIQPSQYTKTPREDNLNREVSILL